MKISFYLFLLHSLSLSFNGQGQDTHFKVNYVDHDIDQEIIYDQIEEILFDRDGFMWFATATGLYMFDGYVYRSFYHHANDETSISENFVTTLFEDSRGNIWIGTYNNGLNVYDKKTNRFEYFRHDPSDINTLSGNKIPRSPKTIVEDKDHKIWVSTADGLNIIDTETKKVKRLSNTTESQLLYDRQEDLLWLAGNDLSKFSLQKGIIELAKPKFELDQIRTWVRSGDLFWLGSNSGLVIYDASKNSWLKVDEYFHSNAKKLSILYGQAINAIYLDTKENIWLAIDKTLHVIETKTGKINSLEYDEKTKNGLLEEKIRGIYGDGKGNILITYESRGITKINLNQLKFKNIGQTSTENSIYGHNVRSVFKDRLGNIWLGTYNHGLNKIKPNGEVIHYQHDPKKQSSICDNFVTAIYIDQEDRLWVGTFEDGFCYAEHALQSDALTFTRFKQTDKLEVHEFFEFGEGKIWIGTDVGFTIFNKTTSTYTRYGDGSNEVESVKHLNIQAVVLEMPNIIWFASWNKGFGKLVVNQPSILTKDTVILFENLLDQNGKNLDHRLINLIRDNQHNFWIASSVNGLVKLEPSDQTFKVKSYTSSMGAPSNTIYSIIEDKKGQFWVSSPNGIGRFDSAIEQFHNFYKSNGLQSNSFIWDSYFQSQDGEIFMGNINGLTIFYPDSITEVDDKAVAYLTKLSINHHEVKIGEVIEDRVLLPQAIRYAESLTLRYDESNISIGFGALANMDPSEIKYSYILEGFDKAWIPSNDNSRLATYTNLPAGNYVFKVRATRNLGRWTGSSTRIKLVILPSWWKTWWAYLTYLCFMALIGYMSYRELMNRSRLRHQLELEEYKHSRDNELNKERFQFFTNLSHELRTPLTLILGPLTRIIDRNDSNNRTRQNLLLIQKQAERLQKLTNQLMNFRKYEIDNLKLKTAKGNVVQFVNEIFIAFRQHAKIKQINFEIHHVPEDIELYYDRDKLEIVFVNLLSNAFKFTPSNGRVSIDMRQISVIQAQQLIKTETHVAQASHGEFSESTKELIQIKVKDTGVGIHPDQLKHVFDRYFQASNIQSISIGGTGIGLEITKNYVELHHGCIMVQSDLEKGTTFYIWLPMGRAHLTEMDIMTDFKPSEHPDHYTVPKEDPKQQKVGGEISHAEDVLRKEGAPIILIVDDNPDIIFFLKENFDRGFNVLTAGNGREAMDLAVEHSPDLIISDIMMPEIDGLEFCQMIKKDVRTSHIPVILLTARTSNIFQAEGLETGADDYITKPFDEKILNLRVKNLIATRQQLRERYSKEVALTPKDITITQPDEEFLNKLIQTIETHIGNSDLKVDWLAKEIGMSHSVLYKKVLALTNLNVVEFVRSIRLKRAAVYLRKTNQPINWVSHEVGFTDPKYFSRCFNEFYGATPSEFRKT